MPKEATSVCRRLQKDVFIPVIGGRLRLCRTQWPSPCACCTKARSSVGCARWAASPLQSVQRTQPFGPLTACVMRNILHDLRGSNVIIPYCYC